MNIILDVIAITLLTVIALGVIEAFLVIFSPKDSNGNLYTVIHTLYRMFQVRSNIIKCLALVMYFLFLPSAIISVRLSEWVAGISQN